MKLFASAAFALLALVSAQSFAEQSQTPAARHNARDTMIMPSSNQQSPFDFNHMAAGSDKSDELGVAYYNQHVG